MKCSTRKCPSPPICKASWGPTSDPSKYNEHLCQRHLDEIYDQNRRLIETGLVSWQLSSLTDREKGLEK